MLNERLSRGGNLIDTEIAKRIKQVREHKNLTQKDFGSQIGVTRDVIGNIEYARVEAKEYVIKLIVSKFNVNEEWLQTGKGEMFEKVNLDDSIIAMATSVNDLQSFQKNFFMPCLS